VANVLATTVAISGGVVVRLIVGDDYELSAMNGSHPIRARLTYRGSSDTGELNWSGEGPGHSVTFPFCGDVSLDPTKITRLSEVDSDPFARYMKKGR